MVVDDVGEMVCRQAIRLEQDGVFERGLSDVAAFLEGPKGAVDEVFVRGVLVWDSEADGVQLSIVGSVGGLVLGDRGAGAVVVGCEAESMSVFCQSVQAVG